MPKGKRFSGQFKFKVALEGAKGAKTLAELASEFGLHPSQISEWKGRLLTDFSPRDFQSQSSRCRTLDFMSA